MVSELKIQLRRNGVEKGWLHRWIINIDVWQLSFFFNIQDHFPDFSRNFFLYQEVFFSAIIISQANKSLWVWNWIIRNWSWDFRLVQLWCTMGINAQKTHRCVCVLFVTLGPVQIHCFSVIDQKQPPELFCEKRCFAKITGNTSARVFF